MRFLPSKLVKEENVPSFKGRLCWKVDAHKQEEGGTKWMQPSYSNYSYNGTNQITFALASELTKQNEGYIFNSTGEDW